MERTDPSNVKEMNEPVAVDRPARTSVRSVRSWGNALHPVELLLIVAFFGLVFLLGLFPLKDTDFWWHLRTGDWILANGRVPRADLYTYTVPNAPWVDLHWGFQVLLAIGYSMGGVPFLTVAKCVITTAAMAVLILGCRRPGWPIWVSVLGWLPALMVLSGRMYVRPETISLLWLSLVLLVIFHWRKHPWIMWLLPPVFICWVNTQGIFILGFVIIAMGLAEVLADPASWRREFRPWWSRAIACVGLSVIAAMINPYGVYGLLFPLELARTMGNPVFRSIGELTPIPQFIQSLGFKQFPLRITPVTLPAALGIIVAHFGAFPLPLKFHLITVLVCLISFVVPVIAGSAAYLRQTALYKVALDDADIEMKKRGAEPSSRSGRRRKRESVASQSIHRPSVTDYVRFSLFRFLMFVAFTLLSLQATRNSHQFAAVLGMVTASNFAQWAALRNARRKGDPSVPKSFFRRISPGNAVALALVGLCLAWVGTGKYYADAGEGRTIGWGEEPLWFPHAAVKAAGADGLPEKFASFHNGHAALYDYYWGPEKKVFSDARLEVIGANLYQDQMRLSAALNQSDPNWRGLVAKAGRPVMLADHVTNSGASVTLLTANDYNCIHFDPIAAVFAPAESVKSTDSKRFDFFAAHYGAEGFRAYHHAERLALARALRNISAGLGALQRDDLARAMALAGIGLTSRLAEEEPTLADAWKIMGQLINVGIMGGTERQRTPESFDAVNDLPTVRAIYALKRAIELNPADFSAIYSLAMMRRGILQNDQEMALLEDLVKLTPINATQAAEIENAQGRIATLRQMLGMGVTSESKLAKNQPGLSAPVAGSIAKPILNSGSSRAEIERNIAGLLRDGQVGRAAETLNAALPATDAPAELLEKLGALRLWLGQPEEARAAFGKIREEPRRQLLLACGWVVANQPEEALKLLDDGAAQKAENEADKLDLFAISAMKSQLTMEKGDESKARAELGVLGKRATTAAQFDLVERLRKQLP